MRGSCERHCQLQPWVTSEDRGKRCQRREPCRSATSCSMGTSRSRCTRPSTGPRSGGCRRAVRPRSTRAVAAAKAASTLPPWRRAEILDAAAQRLDERRRGVRPDHRRGGGQADQAPRGSRPSARGRHVPVRGGRGPQARGRDGPARRGARRAKASSASPSACRSASSAPSAPFNFPLNLVAHKVAPAIAAGCPVVLKPASQTPFSAIALAELLLDECGLPAG